jgi:hypothetical protein
MRIQPTKFKRLIFNVGMRRGFRSLMPAIFLAVSSGAGAVETLNFNKVFNSFGEPKQIHYQAAYSMQGIEHHVEVWRDGQQRVKRRTDDVLETYITKPAGEVEWQMVTLDLKRKIRTEIDRTNLYRIGHFTDWFGLANSIAQPPAGYQLTALPTLTKTSEKPIASCNWYSLRRSGVESKICWSTKAHLPLLITDQHDAVVWRITGVQTARIAPSVFTIDDQGYVRNDANTDIQND